MSKHTPGPWVIQDETVIWSVLWTPDPDEPSTTHNIGFPIADIRTHKAFLGPRFPSEEVEANARLISAAPDMAEALKPFSAMADGFPDDAVICRIRVSDDFDFVLRGSDLKAARAALKKAGIQ